MPPKPVSSKRTKSSQGSAADRPKKKRKLASKVSTTSYAPIRVTSRPEGLSKSADIVSEYAWGPSVPSHGEPWMDTPTGAAANLLSRVWWPLPSDRLDVFEVMRLFADVVENRDITAVFRRVLEDPGFKSTVHRSDHSTALALLRLSGRDGADDSCAAEQEITSALVSATSSMSMSSSEGQFLRSAMGDSIKVVGSCLRQWAMANGRTHIMKGDSLHAHAAKQFYIKHFVEYSENSALKQLVEDAPRLDQVMAIMKGSKCSFSKCNRMARLPSSFCSVHAEDVKKRGGKRKDVASEDEASIQQRKKNLLLVSTAPVKKLINASNRRLAGLRRNKATSSITVSKQGRLAVYSQVVADKISAKQEELKDYRIRRIELVLPPRVGATIPSSFKRLGESLRRADDKVFTPPVRSALPWFRIHWKMDGESEQLNANDSDGSDFEPSQAPRKTEDIVGTGRLLDCPEAMAEGIVRKLFNRSRAETFVKYTGAGTDRVSRHKSKWPSDARDAVRELLSALMIIDPLATCLDLKEDNSGQEFSPQAHQEITDATITVCKDMIYYLDNYVADKSQVNVDHMAHEALTLLQAIGKMNNVPRWTAVRKFNHRLVHDAMASLFAAVCTVTRRWTFMPKYTAIDTSDSNHEDIIWRLANECRRLTMRILGFAANDVSIALERFPGYAEYIPQEIQTTVALSVYNWLLSCSLDPTIIVQISNETVTIDEERDGEHDRVVQSYDPTRPGALDGVTTVESGTPVVEVARWDNCLDTMGYGVRATVSIPTGTLIAIVNFRVNHVSKRDSSFAFIDPDGILRCIDERSIARWINGADFQGGPGRPNVHIQFESLSTETPNITVVASRDIDVGEEITMNYGNSFKTPPPNEDFKAGIPEKVACCLNTDNTMKRFGRLTGITPAWSEPGIESFNVTGSAWAARRWAAVEEKLLGSKQRTKKGFYSSNSPVDAYYAALVQLAVSIPPELKFTARDATGEKLEPSTTRKPKAADFFEVDARGQVKGLKKDFDMYPYGATLLSYHGLRETRKIVISVEGVGGRARGMQGSHFNDAAWEQQGGSKRIRATITDAHIRPLTEKMDPTTEAIHEHSLLLRADVCTSIQDNHPVGPCILRRYWNPSQGDPDELIPTQQTLQGMNNCTLFATFNHTYEGVWHIEPDSAVSLNENVGMHDGFVIIVSDPTAVLELCKLHLFMEMASPGGVDLSDLRKGNTKHGAIQNAQRGLPWLSRPPHPDLLSALGIDTSTFKVYRQKPGEIIFIPGGALHAVVHKGPSVRVACGFVSTEDACRTVIRSANRHSEGAKSTLWSVMGSVIKGDVDVGTALNNMAEDHRHNRGSERWSKVNVPELGKLVVECAETLLNTKALTGGNSGKRKGEPKHLRTAKMKVPVKCQVAGRTGPTFMVTPIHLIAAKDYFQSATKNEPESVQRLNSNESGKYLRHRGKKFFMEGQQRASEKTKERRNNEIVENDEDLLEVSSPQRSQNALSRRSKKSQWKPLYNIELLKHAITEELIGLTDSQTEKLKSTMLPDRFGTERVLRVELALLEVTCNMINEGNPQVVFQDPAHQIFCSKALNLQLGTPTDVKTALQSPPIRDIPGEGTAVHVFTINIGDNIPAGEVGTETSARPNHFASVVCRSDSTVACVLDSSAGCAPESRAKAVENLRKCLSAAGFFKAKGAVQMMKGEVSEQNLASNDYSCMERSILNAAYVVCHENPPYKKVSFQVATEKYTRLTGIIGTLLAAIQKAEEMKETKAVDAAIGEAVNAAVISTVELVRSLVRRSPRKNK